MVFIHQLQTTEHSHTKSLLFNNEKDNIYYSILVVLSKVKAQSIILPELNLATLLF